MCVLFSIIFLTSACSNEKNTYTTEKAEEDGDVVMIKGDEPIHLEKAVRMAKTYEENDGQGKGSLRIANFPAKKNETTMIYDISYQDGNIKVEERKNSPENEILREYTCHGGFILGDKTIGARDCPESPRETGNALFLVTKKYHMHRALNKVKYD